MATADSVKNKIQGLIDSANASTGNADTDLTSAVNSLIEGFGQGKEVYFTPEGMLYFEDHVIPGYLGFLGLQGAFKGAEHLKSFSAPEHDAHISGYYFFESCNNLKKVYLPKITQLTSYMPFRNTDNVEEVQLGSIGYPVSKIAYSLAGYSNAQVTIYVSDDTSIPLAGSPWGWSGSTFIYRSSTTGEVRTA